MFDLRRSYQRVLFLQLPEALDLRAEQGPGALGCGLFEGGQSGRVGLPRKLDHGFDLALDLVDHGLCGLPVHLLADRVEFFMRQNLRVVFLVKAEQGPERGQRQIAPEPEPRGRDRAHRGIGLKQYRAGRDAGHFERGDVGVAGLAAEHHLHGPGHQRMFPAQKAEVFAVKRPGPVKGHGDAFGAEARKIIPRAMFAGAQDPAGGGVFFIGDPEHGKHLFHIGHQPRRGLGLADRPDERLGRGLAAGVEFHQPVPPGALRLFDLGGMLGRGRDQVARIGCRRVQRRCQRLGESFMDAIGRVTAFGKQVQPLVIPGKQDRLGRALEPGDMNMDGLALADAIQPADALFEQVRVQRQVKQRQVLRELKIAPLAADLGAHQRLRAGLILGEVGGRLVPLDDALSLVKDRAADAGPEPQMLFQGARGTGVGADQEQFGRP